MIDVLLHAPHLVDHVPAFERAVGQPLRVHASASFAEEDALPYVPTAEIVITSHWTAALGAAARRLRFLHVPGAGWDKIDPAGIPAGVLVANCYEHERAVAEWVLMMTLALSRELLAADRTIRMGVWRYFPAVGHPLYPELGGRTVGIVGLGRIGREVARLATAFDLRRIAVDALPIEPSVATGLGLAWHGTTTDLPRLLAESDFVVLAVPYEASTRGLFDGARLAQMRRDAFLINPARAELCDEQALFEALRDGTIAGAALDPWWHYPVSNEVVAPSRFPFGELPNVIMTPHASGSTRQTMDRRMLVVAENVKRYLNGQPVLNRVAALSRDG